MEKIQKTTLESAILDHFYKLYGKDGFPVADTIRVLGRQDTPSGRYVDLASDVQTQIDDGYLDLGGSHIELKGLSNGMMAVVLVKGQRVTTLELASYGGESWDGKEDDWAIV